MTLPPEAGAIGSRDEILLHRFARGDRSALGEIVARHEAMVVRLAHRLLGWSDDVDGVVQEVFLAALRHLDRFRGDSSLATWLTTVTVNECRRHRRKRMLRLALPGRVLERMARRAERGPLRPSEDAETSAAVRRAVRALPGKYREVIVLRYLEEMSVEQVGRAVGASPNTVSVRLHRARAKLKDALAGLIEE